MVETFLIVALAIAGAVAFGVDWKSRQRWKSPDIQYRKACVKFDEMMKKGK